VGRWGGAGRGTCGSAATRSARMTSTRYASSSSCAILRRRGVGKGSQRGARRGSGGPGARRGAGHRPESAHGDDHVARARLQLAPARPVHALYPPSLAVDQDRVAPRDAAACVSFERFRGYNEVEAPGDVHADGAMQPAPSAAPFSSPAVCLCGPVCGDPVSQSLCSRPRPMGAPVERLDDRGSMWNPGAVTAVLGKRRQWAWLKNVLTLRRSRRRTHELPVL